MDAAAADARLRAISASLDDCPCCMTVAYGYRHVPGGGCTTEPEWMLVLINPTPRNPTAHANWQGTRFPMAAKGRFWRLLRDAGWVNPEFLAHLDTLASTPQMVDLLRSEAERRSLYLTNAVKCVDGGSNVPRATRQARGWEVLQREIAAVRPRRILAFGLLPFGMLTGHSIRLADELWKARNGHYTPYRSHPVEGRTYTVYPCYFPTGRGNPAGAREMLSLLKHQTIQLSGEHAGAQDSAPPT